MHARQVDLLFSAEAPDCLLTGVAFRIDLLAMQPSSSAAAGGIDAAGIAVAAYDTPALLLWSAWGQ